MSRNVLYGWLPKPSSQVDLKGTGYCTLITGAAVLVQSSLKLFQHEFEEHICLQRCPFQPASVSAGATA